MNDSTKIYNYTNNEMMTRSFLLVFFSSSVSFDHIRTKNKFSFSVKICPVIETFCRVFFFFINTSVFVRPQKKQNIYRSFSSVVESKSAREREGT
jgi:hypothetical protein